MLDELARAHEVGEQDNGLVLYRGAKPARLRLLVSAENELVSVIAGYDLSAQRARSRAERRAAPPREVTVTVQVTGVTREQRDAWTRAAGGRANLSRWMRDACDRAAKQESAR